MTDGICDICGRSGADIEQTVDLLIKKTFNTEILRWLCDDCYKDLVDDI